MFSKNTLRHFQIDIKIVSAQSYVRKKIFSNHVLTVICQQRLKIACDITGL